MKYLLWFGNGKKLIKRFQSSDRAFACAYALRVLLNASCVFVFKLETKDAVKKAKTF